MPPDLKDVGVAAAEAFAPSCGMLALSQPLKAVEIRRREAMMRTRYRASITGSELGAFTTSLE